MARNNSAAAVLDEPEFLPEVPDGKKDQWLRAQYKKLTPGDIGHLIESGKLMSLYFDYEATDLNTTYAAPNDWSGMIVDVMGNIIEQKRIKIQVPEDVVLSPQATLVTNSMPEELYSAEGRSLPHIAAGEIMLFFRNPYRALWDKLADKAVIMPYAPGEEKEVRVYTIEGPDGEKLADIRLHHGGKFLSYQYPDQKFPDGQNTYRDPDGTRWKKIDAPAMTKGYNSRRYDDPLQWAFFHRAMNDDIFMTHTKKHGRYRLDVMDMAKLVAALDGGENGFKAGTNTDKKTGKPYTSFKLSDLMEANTRDAVPERGLDEGIRMPDGSKYDARLAHANPAYDVAATISLEAYLRTRMPDVVRLMEENADFDLIKPFLMNGVGFDQRPVRAFARNVYPHAPHMHFGVCVNINEEIEERRQAILIRTDINGLLKDYTNDEGKKLLDMSVTELAEMLEKQRGTPDALCETINLRKNPLVITPELANKRGKGGNPDRDEANRRFIIENEEFCGKLIEAHSMNIQPMPTHSTISNTQAEENIFTALNAPKQYEIDMGNGTKELLTLAVHNEWVRALDHNRKIDAILRRALKPQPVEFEVRADTLYAFIERMKSVDKDLQKYLGKKIMPEPDPDKPFVPHREWDTVPDPENPEKSVRVPHKLTPEECEKYTANAVEYLWKLRAELMYEFNDNTTRFTVQRFTGDRKEDRDNDHYWHDVPFQRINAMKESDLIDGLRDDGEFRINMERISWNPELVARMFRDADRIGWVKDYMAAQGRDEDVRDWKEWEEYLIAERALRINGAPDEKDPYKQRWMTAVKALEEIAKIRDNLSNNNVRALDDQWGLWDIFLRDRDKGERILNECEKFARRQLADNPLTPEILERLGYDSTAGRPIEYVPYELPAGAKILTIDVPDRMLEEPLRHQNIGSKILMLDPNDAERKALEEMDSNTYLFLRGAQSGRTYLAAKPVILTEDKIEPNSYYHQVYSDAAKRFWDSDMTPPPAEQFLPIVVEALEPKPAKVVEDVQTIKMENWDNFMATVTPALGYRRDLPLLTGVVIKSDGFEPVPGPVRLQGMEPDKNKPGMTESGWEVPTSITDVLTITLRDALERIKIGKDQMKAATRLGFDGSVDALRDGLGSVTKAQAKEAGFKTLEALRELVKKESFTRDHALHYGYHDLDDMKSNLNAFFVNDELDKNDPNNKIHFVDIEPADKANMRWFKASRPMVRLAGDVVDITPPRAAALARSAPATEPPAPMLWADRVKQGHGRELGG